MSTCNRAEALRDYAFDELAGGERLSMEQHLAGCPRCSGELDQLRVTTAALRALPDCELPRRIAFVSDKVFAPSPWARLFGPGLGFLSAAVMATGLVVFAYHRPVEIRTVMQASTAAPVDISKQVNDAVSKAVAQVRSEDAQSTRVLLETIKRDRQQDREALMETVNVLQQRANTNTLLASYDNRQPGAGQ